MGLHRRDFIALKPGSIVKANLRSGSKEAIVVEMPHINKQIEVRGSSTQNKAVLAEVPLAGRPTRPV